MESYVICYGPVGRVSDDRLVKKMYGGITRGKRSGPPVIGEKQRVNCLRLEVYQRRIPEQ